MYLFKQKSKIKAYTTIIIFINIVKLLHKHRIMLIDRNMKKKDLQAAAGISPSSISKLSKNEYVSMDVLVKVCTALGVDFKDIMELVPNMVEERK